MFTIKEMKKMKVYLKGDDKMFEIYRIYNYFTKKHATVSFTYRSTFLYNLTHYFLTTYSQNINTSRESKSIKTYTYKSMTNNCQTDFAYCWNSSNLMSDDTDTDAVTTANSNHDRSK